MDRNQVTGFVLIFFILIAWSYLTSPSQEEIEAAKEKERIAIEARKQREESTVVDTPIEVPTQPAPTTSNYGIFSDAASGQEEKTVLSNDLIEVVFTNKGGRIDQATLNEHFKLISKPGDPVSKIPVQLFEDEKNKWNYQIALVDRNINTQELYFTPNRSGNSLTYRANATDGGYIEHVYTLQEDGYLIDHQVNLVGLSSRLRSENPVTIEVENYLDPIEQSRSYEKIYSTVYFKEKEEDSDWCSCRGDDTETLDGKPVEWVSFANQFFNTSIVAKDQTFYGLTATVATYDDELPDLKKATATMAVPMSSGSTQSFDMSLYIGPNEYSGLNAIGNDLVEIIPFGRSIFGDINRHLIRPFFDWLSQFISSKGIVIILLIFIIKMAVYPLTYKMLKSQAKMGALKPQLAGLKDKYKGDAQKTQMETMKIYREYGVSPLGGCMPMIAQIPIWYALFRFFPASITFRGESFLWAHDLSSYDVLVNLPFTIPVIGAHLSLFTVLYAISQVIYTYYNSKHMDMSANPAMKYVQYMMPLMFFGFFNGYASGLTCYMLFSNLFTIAQTVITKRFVFNDEKLLADLNIQKAKPKKKNSFQTKLAEAMERQQKIQAKKDASNNKKKKS